MHACMHEGPPTCQLLWKMACFSSSATWGLRYQEEGGVEACTNSGHGPHWRNSA
jgi:hypothetical protein